MTDSDRLAERFTLSEGRLFSLADLSTGEAANALDKLVAQGFVRDYYTGLQTLYRLTAPDMAPNEDRSTTELEPFTPDDAADAPAVESGYINVRVSWTDEAGQHHMGNWAPLLKG